MIFRQEEFGEAAFLSFTNSKHLTLVLCNVGASVYMVRYYDHPMTMSLEKKADFIAHKTRYYGQTIGPIALRLRKGQYKVVDKPYRMTPNEKGNALHSSIHNYGFKPFASEVELRADKTRIIFTLDSEIPEKEGVNVAVKVIYTIYEHKDCFDIDYEMVPEKDYCLNPTNHIYWNLGHIDAKELKLTMPSTYRLTYDKDLLCKKRRIANGPIFDFREGKLIGQDIGDKRLQAHATHGYDHYFFLDEGYVLLEDENVRLKITTDREGAQVCTDNYPLENNKLYLMGGKCEGMNSGVTVETLDDPRPWGMPFTPAGATYTSHTSYKFDLQKDKKQDQEEQL